MMPRSFVRGPLRTITTSTHLTTTTTRAFSTFSVLKNEETTTTATTAPRTESPRSSPRGGGGPFGQRKRPDRRPTRRFQDRSAPTTPKFERPAPVPYNTAQPLHFADPQDWACSSVLAPRPLYANVASGNADATPDKVDAALLETATVHGLRAHGDLDPWVEQSVVAELGQIHQQANKDHRKKADTGLDHQAFYIDGLPSTLQEILNPKNRINRFNNGGLSTLANIRYEPSIYNEDTKGAAEGQGATAAGEGGAATAAAKDETLMERSCRRLEYYGGDYSRVSRPLEQLAAQAPQGIKPAGPNGASLLKHVSAVIGQNKSIGFEDKKKMLRAVQKGLNGY